MSTPIVGDTVTYGTGLPGLVTQRAAIVAENAAESPQLSGDKAIVYVLNPQCARFERAPYSATPDVGCWTPRP